MTKKSEKMPYEEDKSPDVSTNEKLNDAWEETQKPSKDFSEAKDSKIKSPEEEAEEKRRKLKLLDDMVSAKLDEKMQELKGQINQELQQFLSQLQTQPQQGQQAQTSPQGIPDMPPEVKAEAISKVGTAIAQVVQAWKGASGAPTEDYFGQMSKNMMLQIIQAGLDGIFKNVYPTYNPEPPNPVRFNPQQQSLTPSRIKFE